jgi:carboxyl-terminal processing protease
MKQNKVVFLLPVLIAIALAVGIYVGKKMAAPSTTLLFTSSDFSEKDKLQQVISYIESDYVDTVKRQMIVEETINEILQNLDPHSYYIPQRSYAQMNDPLEGNFEGIGVEFRIQDDTVVVVQPIGGGPSEKLGIIAGDRIVNVEGEDITGVKINNGRVVKLLKGPKGTVVNIKVKRRGEKELIDFAITRDEIPVYSIDASYMLTSQIGYVKVIRFAKTTYEEFMDAVVGLQRKGMQKLIVDLRNNTGGYMKSAIEMADEFLSDGKLIVYTEGKAREKREYHATSRGSLENTEVAILINENSASASEILAGALQDNDLGYVVGRRSFGKGLVQEGIQWPDGSAIRLTVARYFTPTGRSIQRSYTEGVAAYNDEFLERYESGELLSLDSLDLPDSLKFYTQKGKVLYGGGGILPDYFVPLDTANTSFYYGRLNYQGMFYQFAFHYVDEERTSLLEHFSANNYIGDFQITKGILDQFFAFAEEKGVAFDEKGAETSRSLIKENLKASIGRNLFGDEIFFEVINQRDKVVKKAAELLNEGASS